MYGGMYIRVHYRGMILYYVGRGVIRSLDRDFRTKSALWQLEVHIHPPPSRIQGFKDSMIFISSLLDFLFISSAPGTPLCPYSEGGLLLGGNIASCVTSVLKNISTYFNKSDMVRVETIDSPQQALSIVRMTI